MAAVSRLPDELLEHIFDLVADSDPRFLDIPHRRLRQADLALACRVCVAWARVGQSVLFSEVCVVNRPTRAPPTSSAIESTHQLLAALRLLHARSSDLPHRVRVLHIGALVDCRHGVVYSSLQVAADVIALCPGLKHLDFTIGCAPGLQQPMSLPGFASADIAKLGSVQNLQHLSVRYVHSDNPSTCTSTGLAHGWLALYQMVRAWPSITHVSCFRDPTAEDGTEHAWFTKSGPYFLNVTNLYVSMPWVSLEELLPNTATNLRSVTIHTAGGGTFLTRLPALEALTFVRLRVDEEFDYLSDITSLRSFRCCDPYFDDVCGVLQLLPPSVTHVAVHRDMLDDADGLYAALTHLPSLERLGIVGQYDNALLEYANGLFQRWGMQVVRDTFWWTDDDSEELVPRVLS
ncbi:hypothetical protein EXIGLDRAFT_727672 [Exidia glandulosa HHB12029]|uniref:Uncharacterized protein n=1 Tax=Exidia glandulosa HHB12029 TaxID=1314781 RepID=A0A165DA84_EXIGL|nr:hypothetical protein EXIGLDRAFT_727672 [Exidia glandulosa HHB12029]